MRPLINPKSVIIAASDSRGIKSSPSFPVLLWTVTYFSSMSTTFGWWLANLKHKSCKDFTRMASRGSWERRVYADFSSLTLYSNSLSSSSSLWVSCFYTRVFCFFNESCCLGISSDCLAVLFFSALLLATPIVYKFETRESLLYLGVILPQMPGATKESLLP